MRDQGELEHLPLTDQFPAAPVDKHAQHTVTIHRHANNNQQITDAILHLKAELLAEIEIE